MKKSLALILAFIMLSLSVGCTRNEVTTPAPDTDETEQNNTESPDKTDDGKIIDITDEDTVKKVAQILEDLRSRRYYVEVETIENDRCYVIRGYFLIPENDPVDEICVVYKYGDTRFLTSSVYPYFSVVDSIAFSEERDYMLTVKGRVLSEDNETYTDATAEINIYSYEKKATNTVAGPIEPTPAKPIELIHSIQWNTPDSLYSHYVERLVCVQDTFAEKASEYLDGFVEVEAKSEHDRPAALWYFAREMNLTREDFETYFAALGEDDVPESIYEGLMADTLEESMQLLKSDYAFYNDGKLYTINELGEMYEDGTLPFDITDSAYDEVWKNISSYLDLYPFMMPREVYLLVRERAHDPVKRFYFFYSSQWAQNACTELYIPNTSYYSVLDCNTYEANLIAMNDKYALVHDGTYFIYDYMNGEKVCDIPLSPDEYQVDFVDFSSENFPRYLSVCETGIFDNIEYLLYDIEKQAFVSDEKYVSCVIPKWTDLLCKTAESDGKYITTACRTETLEEVLSVEGMIYCSTICGEPVLAVIAGYPYPSGDIIAFYDTDGNELTELDGHKAHYYLAPSEYRSHILYGLYLDP